MKDKYYTPKIEEFRVGFQYELNGLKISDVAQSWMGIIVGVNSISTPDILSRSIDAGYIRVKHLDHEDVVECGWDGKLDEIGYGKIVDGKKFVLRPFIGTTLIEILKEGRVIFVGTIKNKSVLREVMEMVLVK